MRILTRFAAGRAACGSLIVALAACGATNEEFPKLATSGNSFSGTLPSVYDYSFDQTAKAEIAALESLREQKLKLPRNQFKDDGQARPECAVLPPTDIGAVLFNDFECRRQLLEQRRILLGIASNHAGVLKSYFAALTLLASDVEVDRAAASAGGIAGSLALLNGDLKKNPLFPKIPEIAGIVVGSLRNGELRRHLEQHRAAVGEAIGLQKALLLRLRQTELEGFSDERRRRLNAETLNQFVDPNAKLTASWGERFAAYLRSQPPVTPLSQAVLAVQQLDDSFRSVAAGKTGATALLDQSISYLEAILKVLTAKSAGG